MNAAVSVTLIRMCATRRAFTLNKSPLKRIKDWERTWPPSRVAYTLNASLLQSRSGASNSEHGVVSRATASWRATPSLKTLKAIVGEYSSISRASFKTSSGKCTERFEICSNLVVRSFEGNGKCAFTGVQKAVDSCVLTTGRKDQKNLSYAHCSVSRTTCTYSANQTTCNGMNRCHVKTEIVLQHHRCFLHSDFYKKLYWLPGSRSSVFRNARMQVHQCTLALLSLGFIINNVSVGCRFCNLI